MVVICDFHSQGQGSIPCRGEVVGSDIKWHLGKQHLIQVVIMFSCSKTNLTPDFYSDKLNYENRHSSIPYGLMVVICDFHSQGRGSIPRRGEFKAKCSNNTNFFPTFNLNGRVQFPRWRTPVSGWPYKKLNRFYRWIIICLINVSVAQWIRRLPSKQ